MRDSLRREREYSGIGVICWHFLMISSMSAADAILCRGFVRYYTRRGRALTVTQTVCIAYRCDVVEQRVTNSAAVFIDTQQDDMLKRVNCECWRP